MNFLIPDWLLSVLPPLLGAIIGYVTNALAIRMLFRPLRKMFIFGIPIPLTPGIIPRQRESLAHSIARMVSRSLFNSEVINDHIRGEKFQRALRIQLGELIAPSSGEGEEVGDTDLREFIRSRIEQIEALLLPLLNSEYFKTFLLSLLTKIGGDLGRKTLGDFLPLRARSAREFHRLLEEQIKGKTFRRFKWVLVHWAKRQAEENLPLEQLFSKSTLRRTIHVLDRIYIPAVNFITGFLRRPDIRRELVKRGKKILSDIFMKLNPFQRIVISAGQYDRTLEENMPGIITDLLTTLETTLRSIDNREKILVALHEFLGGFQSMGLGDLERNYGISIYRSVYLGMESLRTMLIREDVARRISEYIFAPRPDGRVPTVDHVLRAYAKLDLKKILERFYDIILLWLEDGQRRERLREYISLLFIRRKPMVTKTESSAGDDLRAAVNFNETAMIDALASGVTMLMEGAVPVLVARFNIYQMVVDRINALAIEEVEQLLLGIIARHLKYINIFGAVLGALIGAAQLLLRFV